MGAQQAYKLLLYLVYSCPRGVELPTPTYLEKQALDLRHAEFGRHPIQQAPQVMLAVLKDKEDTAGAEQGRAAG